MMNILLPQHRRAFSLVELSIVLVILGLLVGGVLSGRSLIRASELRAITTERDKFTSAIYAFRDKYFQLPGDLSNAYQFWGATCGTNTTTASTGCNGDGNGIITVQNEDTKVWEHLARAGLIEGTYTGVLSSDSGVDATNTPGSKMRDGYWDIDTADVSSNGYPDMAGYVADGALLLHYGSIGSATPFIDTHRNLTRGESWSIDKKVDDGRADSGAVRGHAYNECYDSGTDYYNIAGSNGGGNADTTDCILHFKIK